MKKLEDMTLEELWNLFPIELVPYKSEWIGWYNVEKNAITKSLIDENIFEFSINHIGSTAISNIYAKNIVDILLECNRNDYSKICSLLVNVLGYKCMSRCDYRFSFNKGYTIKGYSDKVYHLHLRLFGDNDEIYFRDYLNDHYDIAKSYEKLKLSLESKYKYNRDAYTDAKTDFVKHYTNISKQKSNMNN